jgi:hypothetical protein
MAARDDDSPPPRPAGPVPDHPPVSSRRRPLGCSADNVLGPEVEAFEEEFAAYCGSSHCVGVDAGTSALHLARRSIWSIATPSHGA